jgi:hypothetical protein
VAQSTDDSNTTILPEPELNPLLNPLLAAHMGRWAEVYFTTPPERRAQAVSDLVRELANQPTAEAGLYARSTSDDQARLRGNQEFEKKSTLTRSAAFELHDASLESRARESANGEPAIFGEDGDKVIGNEDSPVKAERHVSPSCESCGYVNASEQRFCVMCGTPLLMAAESAAPDFEKLNEGVSAAWEEPPAQIDSNDRDEPSANELFPGVHPASQYPTGSPASNEQRSEERPAENIQFSVLSDYQSEPASKGYRIYIGLAVAILIGLLVYMTWRSNAAFWGNGTASLPLQAVPAPESQPEAPEPATIAPSPSQPTPKTATEPTPATPNPHPEKAAANTRQPEARRGEARKPEAESLERRAQGRAVIRKTTPGLSPGGKQGEQNGSEELAMAEKYLNARAGTARDSRQAANWLWKAVAKQNATASVMLSDLYLRGDGVSKSCDQARLLLDAAARKGASGAAERLRNLQAFGCR